MSVTYGSDNPDCARIEQPDVALPRPARSSRSKWTKIVLATTGAALCIGGALVMYEGWNSYYPSQPPVASEQSGGLTVSSMALESQAAQALSDVKHDINLLYTGAKIMLRVRGKSFCVDDGGGWAAASTKVSNYPCNPTSLNQVFTYDTKTLQFRSVNKPGLCLDDGGGWVAATTKAVLWYCDTNNLNQKFVMDPGTQMLKNPWKSLLCLDDGGTYVAREKQYVMWFCDNSNPNQHFDVLSWDAMSAEKKRMRAASGNTAYDTLMSGQEVMLRMRGKDMCADDGGGWVAASTKFVDKPCNPTSFSQAFTYDPKTYMFRSVNKPGLCLDDGGGWKAASANAVLWYCDPNNQNQWFVMDDDTLMLRNPVKDNLCLDDGGGTTAGATQFVLWYCDNNNINQHWEVLSRAAMATQKKALRASSGNTAYDILVSGQEIMLRVRGKNLCLDDGGGKEAASTNVIDKACNPNSPNQIFKYDPKTFMFYSVNKPGLCLDDGGGWNAKSTNAVLWHCDPKNQNQWFYLDDDTLLLRSPAKDNLCLDDGGGKTAGASKYVLNFCNNNSPDQHFEVLSRSALVEERKKARIASGVQSQLDILMSGQEILLRVRSKDNLCLDDGGGLVTGYTNFVNVPCNPNSPNQLFKYDSALQQFRSVSKPNFCMDDGGSWSSNEAMAHLWECDSKNKNQWFAVDEDTLALQNPAKNNLCLDDGGAMKAGAATYTMTTCSADNANQHFDFLSRAAFADERKNVRTAAGVQDDYDALYSGDEIMLRLRDKGNLCVDDGGGQVAGQSQFIAKPCKPSSPNQIFVYDANTTQLRSARKLNLCVNDGHAQRDSGSKQLLLWNCDPQSVEQLFEMDDTLMLRNPAKPTLCVDDGGDTTAGATNLRLAPCKDDSADQHFEVLSRAVMAGSTAGKDQTAKITAKSPEVFNSGQEFVLTIRGKDNQCVDDGGGQPWQRIASQFCDPSSSNMASLSSKSSCS